MPVKKHGKLRKAFVALKTKLKHNPILLRPFLVLPETPMPNRKLATGELPQSVPTIPQYYTTPRTPKKMQKTIGQNAPTTPTKPRTRTMAEALHCSLGNQAFARQFLTRLQAPRATQNLSVIQEAFKKNVRLKWNNSANKTTPPQLSISDIQNMVRIASQISPTQLAMARSLAFENRKKTRLKKSTRVVLGQLADGRIKGAIRAVKRAIQKQSSQTIRIGIPTTRNTLKEVLLSYNQSLHQYTLQFSLGAKKIEMQI